MIPTLDSIPLASGPTMHPYQILSGKTAGIPTFVEVYESRAEAMRAWANKIAPKLMRGIVDCLNQEDNDHLQDRISREKRQLALIIKGNLAEAFSNFNAENNAWNLTYNLEEIWLNKDSASHAVGHIVAHPGEEVRNIQTVSGDSVSLSSLHWM